MYQAIFHPVFQYYLFTFHLFFLLLQVTIHVALKCWHLPTNLHGAKTQEDIIVIIMP